MCAALALAKSFRQKPQKLGKLKMSDNSTFEFGSCEGELLFDLASWTGYAALDTGALLEVVCENIKIRIHKGLGSYEGIEIKPYTIPIVMNWNLLPRQDISLNHLQLCQNKINKWAAELNITSGSSYYNKLQEADVPLFCATTVPGISLKEMSVFVLQLLIQLVLDDTMDNNNDFKSEDIPIHIATSVVNYFCEILRGQQKEPYLDLDFPNSLGMCRLIAKLRKKLTAYGINNCLDYFIAFEDYMNAVLLESRFRNPSSSDDGFFSDLYLPIREHSLGVNCVIELHAVMKGISISQRVRRDPALALFNRQVAREITLVNDILSYTKEEACNEKSNFISIYCNNKSIHETFDEAFKMATRCICNACILEKYLLTKYPHELPLKSYLSIGLLSIDTGLQYSLQTQRYGAFEFEAVADVRNHCS